MSVVILVCNKTSYTNQDNLTSVIETMKKSDAQSTKLDFNKFEFDESDDLDEFFY